MTLVVGGRADVRADLERLFVRCGPAATLDNAWAVPEEQHVTVWRCDGPRKTLQEVWPSLAGEN